MKLTTLCFLLRGDEILLAMKKQGHGAGKINGIGGKVEEKETIQEAAVREIEEEVSVNSEVQHLEDAGSIKFLHRDCPEMDQHMHIFLIRNWTKEPQESNEMKPQWYKINEIPFNEMWEDDAHWLPSVLNGKKIEAEFYFDNDNNMLEEFNIKEI